jgi:hypothetical protein
MRKPQFMRGGALALATLLSISGVSRAEFDGNKVEHFAGTSFDTVTWESYTSPPAAPKFIQNDGLTIQSYYSTPPACDYTTRAVTVGVGQGIRSVLTIHPTPGTSSTFTWMWLTTNSEGTTMATAWDSRYFAIFAYTQGVYANFGGTGSSQGQLMIDHQLSFEVPYIWEIDWLSPTSAYFSVSDQNGTVLGATTRTNLSGLPSSLFISIGNENAGTTFSSVQIVPEPSAVAAVLSVLSCVSRRQR